MDETSQEVPSDSYSPPPLLPGLTNNLIRLITYRLTYPIQLKNKNGFPKTCVVIKVTLQFCRKSLVNLWALATEKNNLVKGELHEMEDRHQEMQGIVRHPLRVECQDYHPQMCGLLHSSETED